ncbi:tetratricopeptide repeat protein [Caminibacter mediatlanticus TB-2]|uniref:Tetratricopeptide repeat protein n=1 Tax=Caminibacter mediatlanticus TB-2 TaxID=391592 RepID=A0ABX5V789_9BACT|nr:tetratricopeptide repeat protein [Caminibacter mediatlanticus]QCT94150.1 tetratricopeptide repeat protein [Caminibacter mediatlanticus TB-2]
MKKISFLLLTNLLFAQLDIDINSIKQYINQHPNDIKNRLIIAKYYLKKGDLNLSKKYINEVLQIDPNNKLAKGLQNQIIYLKKYNTIKNTNNIHTQIKSYYANNKYTKLLNLYKTIKNANQLSLLSDNELLLIARVAMWEGKYNLSLQILNKIKNKKNLDYYEIAAYDYYYLGKYNEAKKYFSILYKTTNNKEYLEKLINIYFYLNDTNKIKQILLSIKRMFPDIAQKYEQKLKNLEQKEINNLYKNYKQNPSFHTLEPLVIRLYNTNKNEAFAIIENFLKNHPNNKKAQLLYAKLLSWNGDNQKALDFLRKNNIEDLDAKLLIGKILAWQGEYNKALIYLSDVYNNGNNLQKYNAQKMIGYIYLWENKKDKAKKIFKSLLKSNPNDKEILEELMLLNGNIKPLIKKYKTLLNKNPDNYNFILKLANLYYLDKNYDKAIYYYEKYLKKHPENIEIYKTLADLYLEKKDFYKGFGYFEYYANYKNTKKSYYQLAQRYYWNGFNKEALDVLNNLLKTYPNFENAILLKAKILKINPRYVNTNSAVNIQNYFDSKSQQLKALGLRAYFGNLYETAIEYFKEYLFLKPNDYDIREKYAYALEYNKEYKKAAGEFYLLMWYKKTPLIEYHYAYNLQKIGQTQKAKKIYEKLLNEVPKPIPEYIKTFLNDWKKAWESMNFEKYASYYDKKIRNNTFWRLKKQSIFKKASFISVGIYDPIMIYHKDNIYKIKFFQVYASKVKKDKGYKTLTLKCKNSTCVIIKEKWEPGKYIPFNPKNSLEFYIKQNLEKIKKNSKIKQNIALKKETNINPNKVIIVPGLKRDILPISKVLTNINLKKVNIKQTKKYIKKQLGKKKFWKINVNIDYFKDNQKVSMLTENLELQKEIKYNLSIYSFFKNYKLKQNNESKKGNLYGIGIKKTLFSFDIFNDNSGKKSFIGWHFKYKLLKNIIFNLNKTNLVYSRKSICSSNHSKIKAELTSYTKLTPFKDLWWSVSYEKIDDNNNVFTPQFDIDLLKIYNAKLFFSGWYQFNSKQTDCYYSPKKTDTNILGIKYSKLLKQNLTFSTKMGYGYSFFDKSFIYDLKAGLEYDKNNFNTNLQCKYSNTNPTKNTNDYKSYECIINARYLW